MKIITITLMRKGSKRFPNKNIVDLCGKPLYMHTVDFALQLGYHYYLAHDYDKLDLPVAVNQIERSEYFAGDIHRTNEEILSWGLDADIYILLQVTSPLRCDKLNVNGCLQNFIKSDCDCALSAIKIDHGYYYNNCGVPVNFNQFLRHDNGCTWIKSLYKETGAIYFFKKHMLERFHILQSNKKMIIPDYWGIDIDKEEDLIKAKEYLERRNN